MNDSTKLDILTILAMFLLQISFSFFLFLQYFIYLFIFLSILNSYLGVYLVTIFIYFIG